MSYSAGSKPEAKAEVLSTVVPTKYSVFPEAKHIIPKKTGFEVSPEPEPDFNSLRAEWGAAWYAHVYLFAVIFFILMLYNMNSLLGLLLTTKKATTKRRKIFLATNVLLFFFNFITSLHLFIDPYGSKEHFNLKLPGLLFIIFGLRLPSLTASFSLIHITLTQTSKVKLYSRKLQSLSYLTGLIATHFAVVIIIHFYLVFNPDEFQFIAICQIFYFIFGTLVSTLVIYSFIQIWSNINDKGEYISTGQNFKLAKDNVTVRETRSMTRDSVITVESQVGPHTEIIPETANLIQPRSPFIDKSLLKLFKNSAFIAISGFLYCVAILYSFIFMFVKSSFYSSAWPWLIYQTIARIAEMGMVGGMSYLVRRSVVSYVISKRRK